MVVVPTLTNTDRPEARGYGAAIGELLVRFALSTEATFDIRSAGQRKTPVDLGDTPEEVAGLATYVAALEDLSGGEGRYYADRPNDRNRSRYWRSRGIDPAPGKPGETAGVRLLHDVEQIGSTTPAAPHLAIIDGVLFWASADSVIKVTDFLGATPAETSEDPHTPGTANVVGLAALGEELYAATADGIGKRNGAGTWSNLNAVASTGVWAVKGRILTAVGNTLEETHTTTGANTTRLTLPAGEHVTHVVDAGPAILAAGSDGLIYTLKEESGTLTASTVTPLPLGEHATVLEAQFQQVVVGTSDPTPSGGATGRIYTGKVTISPIGDIFLELALRREFEPTDATVDLAPSAAASRRNDMVVGVRLEDGAYLWRYDFTTDSISEDLVLTEAPVTDIDIYDDRLIIGLASAGIWREATTFVASGWLIGSATDLFSPLEKAWTQGELRGDLNGGQLEVHISTDLAAMADHTHTSWVKILTAASVSQLESIVNIIGAYGRYSVVKVTLYANSTVTNTPVFQSFVTSAYDSQEDVIVTMPIAVSDRIERHHRKPLTVAGYGAAIQAELLALRGEPLVLELYHPPMRLRGAVQTVAAMSAGKGLLSSGTQVVYVVFQGRITQSGAFSGESSILGLGIMGLEVLG